MTPVHRFQGLGLDASLGAGVIPTGGAGTTELTAWPLCITADKPVGAVLAPFSDSEAQGLVKL